MKKLILKKEKKYKKMKIKKVNNYNLLNYNLLNSRSYLGLQKLSFYYLNSIYLTGFRNKFSIFNIKQIKNFIKTSLLVIYKYHYFNKKILFIGFPNLKNNKYNLLFTQTNHYYLPQNYWLNNLLINYTQIIRLLKKEFFKKNSFNIKALNKILNVKQKPDLIVLYNQTKEIKYLQEFIKIKIPFISFLNSSGNSSLLEYKVTGGFQNFKTENFCYLLLKSILTLPTLKEYKEKKKFFFLEASLTDPLIIKK
jgi:ribosomal protein S2